MQIRNTSVGSVLTINNAIGAQSGFYRCSAKLQHVTERTKEARLLVKGTVRKRGVGRAYYINCQNLKRRLYKMCLNVEESRLTFETTLYCPTFNLVFTASK